MSVEDRAAAQRRAARDLAREHGLPERVECPFCKETDTELHSPFGSALSVASYWCRRCHTAFETFKWGA